MSRWRRFLESPIAPAALLAVFATLIAWNIRRFGVWIDESATLLLVGPNDVKGILQLTHFDAHPPLWYLILKPWLEIFGASPLAARAQSALFMLAGFGVWFHFVKTRFSRPVALIALALMATNPMLLHYAIEGRMYAFGIFMVAVTCVLLTGQWRWRWFAYWLCAVVMLYTHYFLALVVLAQFIYLLIARKQLGRGIVWIVVYGASIVAAFIPWFPYALRMTSRVVTNGFWIGPVTPYTFIDYILHTFLHRIDPDVEGWYVFPAAIFMAALGASLIRAGRARGNPHALLWALISIPWVCLFVLSSRPFVPMFHPRYVIFALPALITLLAIGALALTPRFRITVLVVLFAGHIAGIKMMRWRGYNDIRGHWAMKTIAKEVGKPIDGELPAVVSTYLFSFLDAKAVLDPKQTVVHLRDWFPESNTFPDCLYWDRPDWYILSYGDKEVHTHHVWVLDEFVKPPSEVPKNWKLVTSHIRGYVNERLFEVP